MTLNCARLMPWLSLRYCGMVWYFSNSLCQAPSLSGGSTPSTGFHSTIERPDTVSHVAPPIISVSKIIAAAASSHSRTARTQNSGTERCSCMECLFAGNRADHIVMHVPSQMITAHDPEKWEPVFGQDHAPNNPQSVHAHSHPQTDRHRRPARAGVSVGTARHGAGAVGAHRYQWFRGGNLLRGRRTRLGAAGDAADQLDGEAGYSACVITPR